MLAHNYFLETREGQRENGIFRPVWDDTGFGAESREENHTQEEVTPQTTEAQPGDETSDSIVAYSGTTEGVAVEENIATQEGVAAQEGIVVEKEVVVEEEVVAQEEPVAEEEAEKKIGQEEDSTAGQGNSTEEKP